MHTHSADIDKKKEKAKSFEEQLQRNDAIHLQEDKEAYERKFLLNLFNLRHHKGQQQNIIAEAIPNEDINLMYKELAKKYFNEENLKAHKELYIRDLKLAGASLLERSNSATTQTISLLESYINKNNTRSMTAKRILSIINDNQYDSVQTFRLLNAEYQVLVRSRHGNQSRLEEWLSNYLSASFEKPLKDNFLPIGFPGEKIAYKGALALLDYVDKKQHEVAHRMGLKDKHHLGQLEKASELAQALLSCQTGEELLVYRDQIKKFSKETTSSSLKIILKDIETNINKNLGAKFSAAGDVNSQKLIQACIDQLGNLKTNIKIKKSSFAMAKQGRAFLSEQEGHSPTEEEKEYTIKDEFFGHLNRIQTHPTLSEAEKCSDIRKLIADTKRKIEHASFFAKPGLLGSGDNFRNALKTLQQSSEMKGIQTKSALQEARKLR